MKKLFVYGAGQVGVHAMVYVLNAKVAGAAEVVMYAPHNSKRVEGAIEDIQDAQAMTGQSSDWYFRATSNIRDMKGCDFVFFCAGKFPRPEEYAEAAQRGIDDRLLQAVQNIDILKQFCQEVAQFCPQAKIFIITNPVDVMTQIAREQLPQNEIYGLGCYLDTARFRRIMSELLAEKGLYIAPQNIKAWVLGHHCDTMFLHRASLPQIDYVTEELLATAMERTKARGLQITRINQQAESKKINNGSYFAPAIMMANVMISCVTKTELLLPLNRYIGEEDNLPQMAGKSAQLLAKIKDGKVTPQTLPFALTDVEAMQKSLAGQSKSRQALGI